ncbi:SnoaL-like domain-containing protein [Maricaulaceae bacterium MS644]
MFDATLKEIAQELVDANRSGDTATLLATRYSPDCVSVEAAQMGDMPRAAEGLEAIRGKHAWWEANMEFHGGEVDGPFLFDPDRFGVRFTMDVTDKNTGERTQSSEIALYTVKDAKIVREEFFYIA